MSWGHFRGHSLSLPCFLCCLKHSDRPKLSTVFIIDCLGKLSTNTVYNSSPEVSFHENNPQYVYIQKYLHLRNLEIQQKGVSHEESQGYS